MWTFETTQPMGGSTGEGYRNTLNAASMSKEEVLAREAIQNSVDAKDGTNNTVLVTFHKRNLQNARLREFDDVLKFTKSFGPRKEYLDLGEDAPLDVLSDRESSFECLLIEDYNTTGLGGSLLKTNKSSHFRNLLLELGYGGKARDLEGSGGSYGFGKSVYSKSSSLKTIIAYSRFAPTDETEGQYSRLMGCAYFKAHEFAGTSYTGRAWFGQTKDQITLPFTNKQADSLAESIGISARDEHTIGTSILIVGCDFDFDTLRKGVENFWWPRLLENQLDVELYEDDVAINPPRPRTREDLKPYLTAYDILRNHKPPSANRERVSTFQKYHGKHLGNLASVAVEYDDDLDQEAALDSPFINSVAYLRKPKMIVEYNKCGHPNLEPACGVFLSHPDIDTSLKLSEPGLHNKWDANSDRLTEKDSQIVKRVLSKTQEKFRNFQRSLRPAPPKTDGRIRELERLLGKFLKTTNPNKPPPPPQSAPDPFHVHYPSRDRISTNDGVREEGEVQIRLKEDTQFTELQVKVLIQCNVLLDDKMVTGDEVPLKISSDDNVTISPTMVVVGNISHTKPVTVFYETDDFDASWIAQIRVHVETF